MSTASCTFHAMQKKTVRGTTGSVSATLGTPQGEHEAGAVAPRARIAEVQVVAPAARDRKRGRPQLAAKRVARPRVGARPFDVYSRDINKTTAVREYTKALYVLSFLCEFSSEPISITDLAD